MQASPLLLLLDLIMRGHGLWGLSHAQLVQKELHAEINATTMIPMCMLRVCVCVYQSSSEQTEGGKNKKNAEGSDTKFPDTSHTMA